MRQKYIFCLSVVLLNYLAAWSQKQFVDLDVDKDWPEVRYMGVSNNGKYVVYTITHNGGNETFVQSTTGDRKVILPRAGRCYFTQNNNLVVFEVKDSIGILDLRKLSRVDYISNVDKFDLIPIGVNHDLLVYREISNPERLVIRDMENGTVDAFDSVKRYWSMPRESSLVIEAFTPDKTRHIIKIYEVLKRKSEIIWKEGVIVQMLLDNGTGKFVFSSKPALVESRESLWIYRFPQTQAQEFGNCDAIVGLRTGQYIGNLVAFNGLDERVLVNLLDASRDTMTRKPPSMDIWSYKDQELMTEQLLHAQTGDVIDQYKAVVDIGCRKVLQLEFKNESLLSKFSTNKKVKYLLVEGHGPGDNFTEWEWNKYRRSTVYLVSLDSGWKKVIKAQISPLLTSNYVLSYNERYIYYYDAKSSNYFCFRITDGKEINMTQNLPFKWINKRHEDEPGARYVPYTIAGYIKNTDDILVYDQEGLVELRPESSVKAVDLIGIGHRNRDLEIRMTPFFPRDIVDKQSDIPFEVFDKRTKKAGIVNVTLDSLKFKPLSFCLKPFAFAWTFPMKAKDTGLYIVNCMTAEEPANLFYTSDFKEYKRLTDVNPSKSYNWLTTELITWATFDGNMDQGILYKPQDFDPRRKYPLIVQYYERASDGLYQFSKPGLSNAELNIPMYVSQGYLVFTPDIHYKVGWPGRSAYNAIVSGTLYLAQRGYVDIKRMGLQGASFGGFETNYVITHSHLFKAAMSASSMTDFISAYGSIIGDGTSRQSQYELYRDRIGATLWEKPNLYIENSPVLRADKTRTPLLMMANKLDGDVPYEQGLEYFTALRRLGRKVWLLQYDGEGHGLYGEVSKKDLSTRMFQFFNYYLKGDFPPVWMTRGVPAQLKGIDTGLEIDTSGDIP